MLHPAGFWKILGKFLLSKAADLPVLIKQDTAAAVSPRIQSHDIFPHTYAPFSKTTKFAEYEIAHIHAPFCK